ncbi:MAG: hypothetical protein J6L02_03355 [Bacteroidales bacterium]|nr:hypothetical protein [Bacteroidales bacterium]
MAKEVLISDYAKSLFTDYCAGVIYASVQNSSYNADLWQEIDDIIKNNISNYSLSDIKSIPAINATRRAYKIAGKDPNRYRPSAESLMRRVVNGNELYKISTLVDLINLVSLKTGYSIGGFDNDKIAGTPTLGVGEKDEKFEGIGRGLLNIEGLPVYRDEIGGIGTPTSDEVRTSISDDTKNIFVIINGYSGVEGLQEAVDYTVALLKEYANATNIYTSIVKP